VGFRAGLQGRGGDSIIGPRIGPASLIGGLAAGRLSRVKGVMGLARPSHAGMEEVKFGAKVSQ